MISIFAGYNLVTCGLREVTGKVSSYYVPAIDLARCFPHMAECLKGSTSNCGWNHFTAMMEKV